MLYSLGDEADAMSYDGKEKLKETRPHATQLWYTMFISSRFPAGMGGRITLPLFR